MPDANNDTALILHIKLQNIEPSIWRKVAVPPTISLSKLHQVIQALMGWNDSRPHEFVIDEKRYSTPDPDAGPYVISEVRKKLTTVLNGTTRFEYVYDLGDYWEHLVQIERSVPAVAYPFLPFYLHGEQFCPPENVGGPYGYNLFMEVLKDRGHPDFLRTAEWMGEQTHKWHYDEQDVRQRLWRVKN